MKKSMSVILSLLFTISAFGATKNEIATAMTLKLKEYVTKNSSNTPDKAWVYYSTSLDQSQYGFKTVNYSNNISTDGTVIIQRDLSALDRDLVYNTININPVLEGCDADVGTVTILTNSLVIKTNSPKVTVLCWGANKTYFEAYQTFKI